MTVAILVLALAGLGGFLAGCVPTSVHPFYKLENNPYSIGLIPAHVLLRVRATSPTLRMSCLGLDWLKERLKRDPQTAAHVMLPDGRVALTGGTEALQAFIKEHINDADAWNAMFEDGLVRVVARPADK